MYVKQQNSTFRENMHERIAAKCSPQESTILAKEADDSFLACFANEWEMTSNRPPPERSPPKRVWYIEAVSMKQSRPSSIVAIKKFQHQQQVKHIDYQISTSNLPALCTQYHHHHRSRSTIMKLPIAASALPLLLGAQSSASASVSICGLHDVYITYNITYSIMYKY